MEALHHYRAYGLAIASDLPLPELVADAAPTGEPDLRVRLGPTPERIEDAVETRVTWAARPGAWLHAIEGVGRFFVHRDGREVVVERRGGTDADLRAFLFGTTLGAIFHQRGLFVLHASAVALPGGAVAVAGSAGAGKSTTLAEFARRGHPVLSDDKTVVRLGDGAPEVLPGYPTLRLWGDAAKRVGVETEGLTPVRAGIEKYLYTAPRFASGPAPLRLLVVLASRPAPRAAEGAVMVARLPLHEAVAVVLRHTYRRRIVTGAGLQADHFRWAAGLADAVPVVRVVRCSRQATLPAVADAVEQAFEEALAPAPA